MEWNQLLSNQRLGKAGSQTSTQGRTSFHQDYDRVAFSSAFRRLQDKTQVFPLAKSDYVRTRLTHSLEASCVGRSLGMEAAVRLKEINKLPGHVDVSGLGMIVSTACLAHDIGNPPFGHAGEQAIQGWFKGNKLLESLNAEQRMDFHRFEGNAQGFRILVRLQHPENEGGLQLTCATLATFSKYPGSSMEVNEITARRDVSGKKHGFFYADQPLFSDVAGTVGVEPKNEGKSWSRHPLAFLVEAADDICYSIIDLEDGCRRGQVPFEDAKKLLLQVIEDPAVQRKCNTIRSDQEKLGFLRAKAIGALVTQVADQFMVHEAELVKGKFDEELLKVIPSPRRDVVAEIKRLDREKVYASREVIEIEIPGFDVLAGLLNSFVGATQDVAENGKEASPKNSALIKLIPDQFLGAGRIPHNDLYDRLLNVTDFICGMTDGYAVELYKQISGLAL